MYWLLIIFTIKINFWVWVTILFANFAEALAEGRGKARADSLRKTRSQTTARLWIEGKEKSILSADLKKGDKVICETGDIIPGDGEVVEGIASVDESAITGESAPVIRESGGQVGDSGVLENVNEMMPIFDTKKENGVIIHFSDRLPEKLEATFTAKIDKKKRILVANNHSATHLMHAALRKILGTHVEQKGSLVNSDYLRFDFSHFSKVTEEEIAQIK